MFLHNCAVQALPHKQFFYCSSCFMASLVCVSSNATGKEACSRVVMGFRQSPSWMCVSCVACSPSTRFLLYPQVSKKEWISGKGAQPKGSDVSGSLEAGAGGLVRSLGALLRTLSRGADFIWKGEFTCIIYGVHQRDTSSLVDDGCTLDQ